MLMNYSKPILMPSNLAKIFITRRPTEITNNLRVIWTYSGLKNISHDENEVFEFKSLGELEKAFMQSGEYNTKEVKTLMNGLSRLPRYATKKTNKSGSTR